jgi:hypothetical protein
VIDVVTATPTEKEKLQMNTLIPHGTFAAKASSKKPKVKKKLHVAPRRAHVAPAKAKSPRKAMATKKASQGRLEPQPQVAKSRAARDGSKTAKMLDLLKRLGGASSKELMKATGWLPHSVRGFLSGTVRKKMGLTVISTKGEDGERTYSVEV